MTTEPTALARPKPGDTFRVVGASMRYAMRALFRRLVGRRGRPSWGVGMELMVASTQGAWSTMTELGVVRWRNVGNGLSPLRFDGITPRFARLEGLPPLLIQAGAAETLVDQIRACAERAKAAGVDVTLSVYDDMVHVWHLMRSVTPGGPAGARRDQGVREEAHRVGGAVFSDLRACRTRGPTAAWRR